MLDCFKRIATYCGSRLEIQIPQISEKPHFSCRRLTSNDDMCMCFTADNDCFDDTPQLLAYDRKSLRFDPSSKGITLNEAIGSLVMIDIIYDLLQNACNKIECYFNISGDFIREDYNIQFFKDKDKKNKSGKINISTFNGRLWMFVIGNVWNGKTVGSLTYPAALAELRKYVRNKDSRLTTGSKFRTDEDHIWHEIGRLADKLDELTIR